MAPANKKDPRVVSELTLEVKGKVKNEEVCFMFSQLKNRGFITGFITKNRGKTGSDF